MAFRFNPLKTIGNFFTGGTGGGAQWQAAQNYNNRAQGYLGQNDLLTNQYNGMAGQARANYNAFAPQTVQAQQRYINQLQRPAYSSAEDQAAIAQATRGTTDAYGRTADNIRQTFAERGGTGSGAELAALTNNQIRQAGTIADATNNRAMDKVALGRQNAALLPQVLQQITAGNRSDELNALGLIGQNAQYGAGVNLNLAQGAQNMAQQQDALKAQRQAQVFGAVGSLVPLLRRNQSVSPVAPTAGRGTLGASGYSLSPTADPMYNGVASPWGGTTNPTTTRQPTMDDIAAALRAAGFFG